MKVLKKIVVLVLVAVIAFAIAGCKKEKENYKIGFCVIGQTAEFQATVRKAMDDWIAKNNYSDLIDFTVLDANNDVATQVGQIDNMIAMGMDAIILMPADADALVPGVEAAVAAKIPIITVDAMVNSDLISAHVGTNDFEAGKMQMQYVADKIGGAGNIIILHGPNGISAEVDRRAGYEDVLKNYPNIKVLIEPTADWEREKALSSIENQLQAFPDIDAIVAMNDEMAMGALQAVIDAGKVNEISVSGIDAIDDALEAVKAGTLDMTIYCNPVGQGEGAMETALKLCRGEAVSNYFVTLIPVTKENVDEYR